MTTTCDACALPLRALRKIGEGLYCPPCAADIEAVKRELLDGGAADVVAAVARAQTTPATADSSPAPGAPSFEDAAPLEVLDLFRDLGLPAPNPLWYVGRLDERPRDEKERER